MSRLIRFDVQKDPEGAFARRVAELRSVIRRGEKHVLATSVDAFPTAVLAWAAWAEGRRLVFAPTDQPGVLAELTESRNLLALSGEERDPDPIESPFNVSTTDVLVEFYTSGSTGEPLRVSKNKRQLFGEGKCLTKHFSISEDDVVLSGIPARHVYGFLFSVMIPHLSGCFVVDERPQYPASIHEVSGRSGATVLVSTPGQLHALSAAENMPDVRIVFSSGARLRPDARVALEKHGLRVAEIFGSTETGGIAFREDSDLWTPFEPVVIDTNQQGNLLVNSPFLENPSEFWECQDRVEIENQKFRDLGRSDDIVKVGAKRVSLDAIEELLLVHPDVRACAVFVEENPRTRLHAFVVVSAETTASDLRKSLLSKFDPVTIPRIHLVEQLPYTDLGKVSRKSLEELLTAKDRGIEVLSARQDSDDHFELEFLVHESCAYFEGHFDGFPILAGIAQMKFVEQQISAIWEELKHPIRFDRLKFRAPIYPNTNGTTTIVRQGGIVAFKIESKGQINTSGDMVYFE